MDKRVEDWIRNAIKNKIPIYEIVKILKQKNFSENEIYNAIEKAKSRSIFGKIIMALFLIFMIVLAVLGYMLLSPYVFHQTIIYPAPLEINKAEIQEQKISADTISYLLSKVTNNQLKQSVIPKENPIINMQIGNEYFYTIFDYEKGIETFSGSHNSPDIKIISTKQAILDASNAESPLEFFKTAVRDGKISLEAVASDIELFQKGYLGLQKELSA